MAHQQLGNVQGSRARGQHQGRLALLVRHLHVAACIKQHFDQARIGNLYRLRQRARAVIVDDIGLRPALEQRAGKIRVDLVDCPVQRRCTVSLGCVHIGARGNHLERGVAIAGLDQTGEAVIGGGGRAGRCEAKNDCENGALHDDVHQSTSGAREL